MTRVLTDLLRDDLKGYVLRLSASPDGYFETRASDFPNYVVVQIRELAGLECLIYLKVVVHGLPKRSPVRCRWLGTT